MESPINILQLDQGEATVGAASLFDFFGITITNSMTSGVLVLVTVILLVIYFNVSHKKDGKPGKFQVVMEMAYNAFYGLIVSITSDERVAKKIFPIIGTIFIYVGISNVLLTVVPGLAAITFGGEAIGGFPDFITTGGEYFFRTHTNDFSVTFGIAVAVIIWTQLFSIQKYNIFGHIGKYIKIGAVIEGFKQGIGPGFLSIIDFLIGLLDIVSELAKSLSLSIRLFGNMFAGELLSGIVLSAFALVAPVPLMLLGLFTGFLQALVFGALTSSYFGLALSDD